jgi:hypothetical protein
MPETQLFSKRSDGRSLHCIGTLRANETQVDNAF